MTDPKIISAICTYGELATKADPPKDGPSMQKLLTDLAIQAELCTERPKAVGIAQEEMEKGLKLQKIGDLASALPHFVKALQKEPADPAIIKTCFNSLLQSWQHSKKEEIFQAIGQLAKVLLLIDPNDLQAQSIVRVSLRREKSRLKRRLITVGSVVIALLITIALFLQYINRRPPQENTYQFPTDVETEEARDQIEMDPNHGTFDEQPPIIMGGTTEGLKLVEQDSTYGFHPSEGEYSYHLRAELWNTGNDEIVSSKALIQLVSKDGGTIAKKQLPLLPIHKGPLRPGDVIGISALFRRKKIEDGHQHPQKVVVTPSMVKSRPPEVEYPESLPTQTHWELPIPEGMQAETRIRSEALKPSIIEGTWATHAIEFHNTGSVPIQSLLLQIDYNGENDETLLSDSQYAVTANGPNIPVGQFRVLHFRNSILKTPASISMHIIEAE
jgi:hypothetical protein